MPTGLIEMPSASSPNYELLDFGDGRKLERFGDVVLDRPCPAAEGATKSRRELWLDVAATFDGNRDGRRRMAREDKCMAASQLDFMHDGRVKFRLGLDPLPSGQVGVFPEQDENWNWIAREVTGAVCRGCVASGLRVS